MSSNEYLFSKNRLFESLQHLDNGFYFPIASIGLVKFFKREFKFLDIFLSLHSFTDEPDILDLIQKVEALFQDSLLHISKIYRPYNFDYYASEVENKIWLTKMAIRAKYSFPKISLVPLPAKFVTDFIDTVVENLHDLVKVDDPHYSLLYVPEMKEHIEDVLKELKLLKTFICFVSERSIEIQSQPHVDFLNHVLAVAGHATMLSWLYLKGPVRGGRQDLAPEKINTLLSDLLQMRIKPIQPCIRKIYVDVLQDLKVEIQSGCYVNIQNEYSAEVEVNFVETILHNLVELSTHSNSSQRVALKDHLPMLHKMLNFLRANIIHLSIQDLQFLLRDIDTVIIDVVLLVYSLYEGEEEKEDKALGEVNPAVGPDFPGNIECINTVIYIISRKVFQSNLPKIHGLGYVDFLLNNLKEFQGLFSDSLAFVRKQLQNIQMELEMLQPFLEDLVEENHKKDDKLQSCPTLLIGKAYEIEYIVDAGISKEVPVWCLERWLLDIMEEITVIRGEVAKIQEKKIVEDAMNVGTTHMSSNLARTPRMNEEIVGFEDVIEKLRDQLIQGTRGRDVISIVGMPGLGKTTLAYRIYSDRLVVSHFDIRAQCCVSQVHSCKDLLLAILSDAIGEDSNRREKHADELADELRKALFYKRYLILVDDVWEASVWDDLIGCFQDANNGSRIIITTRNHGVSNYVRFESDPLLLRMFKDDESWELLRKKVFEEEICSLPLMNIGNK